MGKKLSCLLKFILKLILLVGITGIILFTVSVFFGFSLESLLFIVGVIYLIIGGSTVFGDAGRRVDVNYLQSRSLESIKSWDEVANNKQQVDSGTPFIFLMMISGFLLIGMTYWL